MRDIFVGIPSYAEPDIANTLESMQRMSSGATRLRVVVVEQVTRYVEAYSLGLWIDNFEVESVLVGDELIGLGGARRMYEDLYQGEEYQVQLDAHVRFEAGWDLVSSHAGCSGGGCSCE